VSYRLLSVAEAELVEAAKWYEKQAPGLGQQFLDEFEATMDRVTRFPEAWTRISNRHRRCRFRRFPYAVIYSRTESSIRVAAVADMRRDPERMKQRSDKT
jgi:plasmid stabilization system protein ParE